ncbi:MAG: DUF4159 domain-containing protein [Chthoniobacter sp.]
MDVLRSGLLPARSGRRKNYRESVRLSGLGPIGAKKRHVTFLSVEKLRHDERHHCPLPTPAGQTRTVRQRADQVFLEGAVLHRVRVAACRPDPGARRHGARAAHRGDARLHLRLRRAGEQRPGRAAAAGGDAAVAEPGRFHGHAAALGRAHGTVGHRFHYDDQSHDLEFQHELDGLDDARDEIRRAQGADGAESPDRRHWPEQGHRQAHLQLHLGLGEGRHGGHEQAPEKPRIRLHRVSGEVPRRRLGFHGAPRAGRAHLGRQPAEPALHHHQALQEEDHRRAAGRAAGSVERRNLREEAAVHLFTGHRDFKLTDKEVENLGEYLRRGGCIWGDSSLPGQRSRFDIAFRREMLRLVPDPNQPWKELPASHPIFTHAWYTEIKAVAPGLNYYDEPIYALMGYGGEIAVLYTANDYGDMWQFGIDEKGDIDLSRDEKKRMVAVNEEMWYRRNLYYRNIEPKALFDTYKFGTNIIIHLLTRWEEKLRNVPQMDN